MGLNRFGSVGNSIAFLRGETVHVGNPSQTIIVKPHQPFEVNYDMVNLSNAPIKIIGAQSSCTCTSISALPMTLEPHQSKTVSLQPNSVDLAIRVVSGFDSQFLLTSSTE